ncbi:MAG: hypothetical protein K1060chlam2_00860 [Chlamydiae bacterium]|nr:hypothetical protein [Chlamydiota bacterium]
MSEPRPEGRGVLSPDKTCPAKEHATQTESKGQLGMQSPTDLLIKFLCKENPQIYWKRM